MRLQNNNSKVQFLSLKLLETMIQKCDDFVHFQVIERRILPEMVKILRKSKSMQVRETILVLLESWQEAFRGPNGRYPQFYDTYIELKRAGVRFPENKKNDDLKFTPLQITNQLQIAYEIPTNTSERLYEIISSEIGHFSLSDLHNIQNTMDLFTSMLQVVNQNNLKAINDEVITDLFNQCVINQKKLIQLINSTENDKLLVEALSLNDSLQAGLSKYNSLLANSSLSPETTMKLSRPNLPPPATSEESHQLCYKEEEEEDEDDDGFSIIAKRKSLFNASGVQKVPDNSSEQSSAIVLFDPPAPASSSKKEEDLIDLFSLTLSSNQPPPSPHPISDSLNWEHYLNHPQPLMPNEGYNSYNSYIAPWARPAAAQLQEISPAFPQQQTHIYSSNYLPPFWSSTEGTSNPFLSTTYVQYPASQPISRIQKLS